MRRGEAVRCERPAGGQGCRVAMLDPDSGLSLTIARIVQRLKGSSLHSQLERQARVSPDPAPWPPGPPPFPVPRPFVPGRRPWPGPCGLRRGPGASPPLTPPPAGPESPLASF